MPSINDSDLNNHKLSFLESIVWQFGYINAFDYPIARKNRITGKVQFKRYNESFGYWSWMDVNETYKTEFIAYEA